MTNSNQTPRCIHCEKTSQEVPLVRLQYQEQELWICTQDLPIMIHSPAKLADKLPGLKNVEGHQH